MKLKFSLFFLLTFAFSEAQITDLQKLSTGKFYSYDVIKDVDNNIKGYFFLYETDRVAKETFELEYVVLDENLNKVTNGFITEMKFESLLIKAQRIKVGVTLHKNKLLLRLTDYLDSHGSEGFRRFRILDLQTNKMTDAFCFLNGSMDLNPKLDRKIFRKTKDESEEIYFLNDVGLVVNNWTLDDLLQNYGVKSDKLKTKDLIRFDDNFNPIWKTVCEDKSNKKRQKNLEYLDSDKDVMLFFNRYTNHKGKSNSNDASLPIFNTKTGGVINEFVFENLKTFNYKVVDIKFTENEIILWGNFSKKYYNNVIILDTDNTGLFSYRLNKADGKLIESKYLYWKDIGDKLNIDKSGFVEKEGNLFIHNMLPLSDGKIIVVCEAFKNFPITTNNMYFFELSIDFKLNQAFEVSKFRNKFPDTNGHSSDIKKYGLFDFVDYQNMGDDEFLFFFNDNEKNAKRRNKSTIYGVVSYSDGKFKRQTIDLKTEVSSIKAFPAKKGYITLVEDFDDRTKPTELRLEKINY